MMEILSRLPNRDVYIITKSLPEQYANSKIKIKEIGEEVKPLSEYESAIIIFDDIFATSKRQNKDQFSIRGRHDNLDFYYLSQSYFDLPKRSLRIISNKLFLFTQTLMDIENLYRNVGGYDMSYDEFKQLGRK